MLTYAPTSLPSPRVCECAADTIPVPLHSSPLSLSFPAGPNPPATANSRSRAQCRHIGTHCSFQQVIWYLISLPNCLFPFHAPPPPQHVSVSTRSPPLYRIFAAPPARPHFLNGSSAQPCSLSLRAHPALRSSHSRMSNRPHLNPENHRHKQHHDHENHHS